MGNRAMTAGQLQRTANKKFTDPKQWESTIDFYRRDILTHRNLMPQEHQSGETAAVEGIMRHGSHIDPDELYATLEETERKHREESKLNPDEVTNALRLNLYQQRQYLSYKDTMQRLGVPQDSILPIDRWSEQVDNKLTIEDKDQMWAYSDRMVEVEISADVSLPPEEYDTLHGVEEGDNRVTDRMLMELLELQQEGKLDFEAAGRELNRDPEILRRIVAPIRLVPPVQAHDSNMDMEAAYHLGKEGNTHVQREGFLKNMKSLIRGTLLFQEHQPTNYDKGGTFMEDIPARGFKTPAAESRAANGPDMTSYNYQNPM
eukprot:TRINITY_DN36830_c0_g1_i1.p1 TRINITY_DN36830_c0_g1~~TRINITY_DN36830_c0_g1_i1.p1  ORF type:complete len:325 (+),score=52.92 TRINITY_DN36830_c0_g1_i1:27-977(+)